MKLSRASSYALHAITHMAAQKKEGPQASHHVAQARGIPERFLLKVLKPLVTARILHSVKGPNGGYRIIKSPNDISVLDIIEAVDGPIRGQIPFDEDEGDNRLNKKLEGLCKQSADQTRSTLGNVHISDLVGSVKKL